MKKRKILKCATLCAMVAIVLVMAILPTFAMRDSGWLSKTYPDCVYCINGSGTDYKRFYDNYRDKIMTNGDILIGTAPKIITNSITFIANESDYNIYFYADDNAQIMGFKLFNPTTNEYYYVGEKTDIYCFMVGTRMPTIKTTNLYNFDTYMYNTYGYTTDWINWYSIPGQEIKIIPYDRQNLIYNAIAETQYQNGFDSGYAQGKTEGEQIGYSDALTTRETFLDFVSAIFTAPGHFISTVFDFELFGYNIANVVRVLLTIALLAVTTLIVLKFIL